MNQTVEPSPCLHSHHLGHAAVRLAQKDGRTPIDPEVIEHSFRRKLSRHR